MVKTVEEEEEEAFYMLVDEGGFTLPFPFRNWKAHFKTRSSFLSEAAKWLKAEYDGTPKRVITDVECGRGCYNSELIKNGQVTHEDRILYEGEHEDVADWSGYGSDDYEWSTPPQRKKWTQGVGYQTPRSYYQSTLWQKKLPLTPVIEAPSGQSGKMLVVL